MKIKGKITNVYEEGKELVVEVNGKRYYMIKGQAKDKKWQLKLRPAPEKHESTVTE